MSDGPIELNRCGKGGYYVRDGKAATVSAVMRDVGYLHLLLDEVIDRYGLPASIAEGGNVEAKIVTVLQELVKSGDDTQVGVTE